MVEGVLNFLSRDLIFLWKVPLDDPDVLADADLCVRLLAGPESLLDIVGG